MTESPSGTLTPRDRIDRTRARSWVLHILFSWESRPEQRIEGVLEEFLRTRRIAPPRRALVERHLNLLIDRLPEIDRALDGALDHWRLERLSRIDRAVLRLAAAEILYSESVPPKVALQEGIRLAGQYGGPESPRFVNGVLDAIYRRREEGS